MVGLHDGFSLLEGKTLGPTLGQAKERPGRTGRDIARGARVPTPHRAHQAGRVAADELILKRDDRLSSSRVSLAGTAAEELAIDPARRPAVDRTARRRIFTPDSSRGRRSATRYQDS